MKKQNTKKLLVTLGLSCLLLSEMPLNVNAAIIDDADNEISVQYVNISNVTSNLSITGKSAQCTATITAQSGKSCSLTVTLQKKSGTSWTNVKSWSKSSKGSCKISESYSLSQKGSYRLKAVGKSGTESKTLYSKTQSY